MHFSPLINRLIAISLVIFPLAFIIIYGIAPLFSSYAENEEDIATKRFLLAKYLAASNIKPQRLENTSKIDKTELKKNFLHAGNKNIALANLQSLLKQLAARYQSATLRANQLPDQKKGPLTYIGVRIEFLGTPNNIMKISHEIEKHQPYLFIRKADFSIRQFGQVRPGVKQNKLHTQFSIYAAYWTDEDEK